MLRALEVETAVLETEDVNTFGPYKYLRAIIPSEENDLIISRYQGNINSDDTLL